MTIPAAILLTIGVIVCAAIAFATGDPMAYKSSAIIGAIGTLANMVFFYRRVYVQLQAERRRLELKKMQGEKPL